jgi:hypothetical protein
MSQTVPEETHIRARFDSGFYSKDLFAKLEEEGSPISAEQRSHPA